MQSKKISGECQTELDFDSHKLEKINLNQEKDYLAKES